MNNPRRSQGGVGAYNQVAVQTGVHAATPHRLIQMLINAALEKVATAKGFMKNNKVAEKGNQISLAVSILDVLRASLDKQKGGEISANLDALYDYMIRQLTEANLKNSIALLDEVASLLMPIKEAWDAIPEEVKLAHQREQEAADLKQQEEQAAAG